MPIQAYTTQCLHNHDNQTDERELRLVPFLWERGNDTNLALVQPQMTCCRHCHIYSLVFHMSRDDPNSPIPANCFGERAFVRTLQHVYVSATSDWYALPRQTGTTTGT